ncbi:zinc ABC transporter solute-binding protein [Carnobacterium sp. PL24RED07]|uniref:metal ABC transporter solute-binding protein, Zn/Mn family n=1 Tax=unclassified Carnobacterium TaxID=257487 RepID=UPI0011EDD8FB|nr:MULTISPECIES: zinc ABC transporter substrate-binding protein [unclassified Carnobacterium]KAF3300272.1 zinc ABC transporter solute-binding protein [Carnobacterium sp. PL26RED25]KAF3304906.1 zinc ABC transporter solute-binding protein [Carnobacterium sp. PL24RED07]
MNKFKRLVVLLALSAIAFLAACGNGASTSSDDDSLQIITTFYPMQALTNAVVGDSAEVTVMMENADTHEYEPSAQDIATLNEADVFVYNSEDMEIFVPTLLESIDNPDLVIIEAASEVELIDGDVETVGETTSEEETEEEHTDEDTDAETEEDHESRSHGTDPHTWLDPVNAVTEAQTIANALTEADPDNAETYQENAGQFASDMMAVHDEYASLFELAETKTFLTQHAAFGYLANRYGLHQAAVTGVTESAEPSPKRIAEIVSYMEENNISVIYGQAGGATEIATTIASEVGGTVGELQSMESVDTSQYPADGDGFIAIIKANLESLAEGVQ